MRAIARSGERDTNEKGNNNSDDDDDNTQKQRKKNDERPREHAHERKITKSQENEERKKRIRVTHAFQASSFKSVLCFLFRSFRLIGCNFMIC